MRLIDADALGIGRCDPDIFPNKAYAAGWNGVIGLLDDAPTVDAVPVVHGEWIKPIDEYGDRLQYECSECGEYPLLAGDESYALTKYCPHCGAKMDGDKYE